MFRAALDLSEQVSEYRDLTIMQADMQTRFATFIRTGSVAGLFSIKGGEQERDYSDLMRTGVEGGTVNVLSQGDDITNVAPTAPGQYFDMMIVRMARFISAVSGMPYELVMNDIGRANYSSIRASLTRMLKRVMAGRGMMQPCFDAFRDLVLLEAYLDRKLPDMSVNSRGRRVAGVPSFQEAPELWGAAVWDRVRLGWISPKEEVNAYDKAVSAGFMSRAEVIQLTSGRRIEDVTREQAYGEALAEVERAKAREHFGLDPKPVDPKSVGPDPDPSNDPEPPIDPDPDGDEKVPAKDSELEVAA